MAKRKTEANKSFEATQEAAAAMGRSLVCRRTPGSGENSVRPADERPVARPLLDGMPLDLESKERGGGSYTPNYKGRVERFFRHRASSLTRLREGGAAGER